MHLGITLTLLQLTPLVIATLLMLCNQQYLSQTFLFTAAMKINLIYSGNEN